MISIVLALFIIDIRKPAIDFVEEKFVSWFNTYSSRHSINKNYTKTATEESKQSLLEMENKEN